jgi:hypothetical protein
MRLRLTDPSSARRLAAFLRSVGVETTEPEPGVLLPAGDVEASELAIYVRVWTVLHPGASAELET